MPQDVYGNYEPGLNSEGAHYGSGDSGGAVSTGTTNPNTSGATSMFYNQFSDAGDLLKTWVRRPDGAYE